MFLESPNSIYIPRFYAKEKFGDPTITKIEQGTTIDLKFNGKLRSELEIEKKNHTLSTEALELEVKLKDKELGRMMKKLQKKSY